MRGWNTYGNEYGKISEKLAELLEMGRKKKNVLEYQEINDFFGIPRWMLNIWTKSLTIWKPMESTC